MLPSHPLTDKEIYFLAQGDIQQNIFLFGSTWPKEPHIVCKFQNFLKKTSSMKKKIIVFLSEIFLGRIMNSDILFDEIKATRHTLLCAF